MQLACDQQVLMCTAQLCLLMVSWHAGPRNTGNNVVLSDIHHLPTSGPIKSLRTSLPSELQLASHAPSLGWHAFQLLLLCRPYVLPERYVIPLVPGDYNMIDRPRGMLFVTVISAHNVPKMDWFNGSDPYVRYAAPEHSMQSVQCMSPDTVGGTMPDPLCQSEQQAWGVLSQGTQGRGGCST